MSASYLLKKSPSFVCLCSGIAMLTLPLSAAHAGFDWTPPRTQQVPDATPQVAPQAAPSELAPLTPEPVEAGLPVPVGTVDAPEPITPAPITPAPVAPVVAPAPVAMPSQTPAPSAPAPSAPVATNAVVQGFGKEIPLALALRDIVPSSYTYAFGSGDMASVKISWRGGKAWQDVLAAALAPQNLQASVSGNTVTIIRGMAAVPAAPMKRLAIEDHPAETAAPAAPAVAPIPLMGDALTSTKQNDDVPPVPVATAPTPAPSSATLPVIDLSAVKSWEARPGMTLRSTLESWSKTANVELSWSTAYDYPVNTAFHFNGTFHQAIDALIASYHTENPAPKGFLYPNLPKGPSVLLVN